MAATYTATINSIDRAATHVLLDGFKINEITNGINTLVCRVGSEDASYRPLKRQTIEIEEDDGTSPVRLIFGGTLRTVREHGWGMTADGDDAIILELSADSYKTLASRRFVTATYPSQPLGTTFADVVNTYLNVTPYFVTVDPGQVAGPTLEAMEFKVVRVDDVFNFLATLSAKYGAPFTWTIGYDLVAGMYQTGTVAAPWDLLESDFTTTESSTGDIEVEPTDENYANKIILVWGNGTVIDLGPNGLNTPEPFVGNGVTNTFTLKYQLLGPIPGTNIGAVGYAYVNVPGGIAPLGSIGTANMEWEYDPVTNSISRVAGPPPLGFAFSVPYRGLLTGQVTAEDAAEIAANGLWEDKILAPEIEDPVLAQTVADAELVRRIGTGRIVRFRTRRMPGPQPGETMTITVPKRNISGSFTVTDVATENDPGNVNALVRTVTCNSSIHEQAHQTLTRWWSEKDTAGISQPAGASAVPDLPLFSAQYNDNYQFGGAEHILYLPLTENITSPQNSGWHFVNTPGLVNDPERMEIGLMSSGDFTMDLYSPAGVQSSILMNAPGDIFLTAGLTINDSPPGWGAVALVGNQSIVNQLAALSGIQPGVDITPGPVGDSFSRLNGLTVLDSLAGLYQTITSLPYTVHTTTFSNTTEILTFFVNSTSGTVNLPETTAGNYRVFPNTGVGRMFFFKNIHASGVVTIDPFGGELIDGAATLTLGPGAGALIHRFDTSGWKVLLTTGGVTLGGGGGGGGAGTPAGNDKDVQFNDGGAFGGEDAFEYDKTTNQLKLNNNVNTTSTLKVRDGNGEAAMIALQSFHAAAYADITFGWERVTGTDTARTANPGYFFFGDTGAAAGYVGIGGELSVGETPGSAMAFADGRRFILTSAGIFKIQQYGGLGTGAVTGCGIEVDCSQDGNDVAAYLSLQAKDATRSYLWFDANDRLRRGTAPPQEDGTPADTSGYINPDEQLIIAASDESVSSSTTLQNDDELILPVGTNEVWLFEMVVFVTTGTSTTPDFKYNFTIPASATLSTTHENLASGATNIDGTQYLYGLHRTLQDGSGGVLSTGVISASVFKLSGVLRTAGTAGNMQFQFAQLVSDAEATVRKADSYIHAWRAA